MISKLHGILDAMGDGWVILDVQGVGYRVYLSSKSLTALETQSAAQDGKVTLYTEMLVRNDLPTLYGFYQPDEQALFNLLITVQGVGARMALSLLSCLTLDQVHAAIATQDKKMLTQADGIGPRLATRIVTELKDKIAQYTLHASVTPISGIISPQTGIHHDALSALENLGYRRQEAWDAVQHVIEMIPASDSLSEVIRLALARLGTTGRA